MSSDRIDTLSCGLRPRNRNANEKALEGEGKVRDISLKVMKSSISIFESYNRIRNDESFAHDNEIVDRVEARFIFDAITNILRFMKGYEASRFGR